MNWQNIAYLQSGTARQQEAHSEITKLGILQRLENYRATLVSTICINIDIPESDLDIICQYSKIEEFEADLRKEFIKQKGFKIKRCEGRSGLLQVVAEFRSGSFLIEVFGSSQTVEKQNAFRHLSVASRLIQLGGDIVRQRLRELKLSGLKTEAAIARLLKLSGDPYEAVLDLEKLSDQEILNKLGGVPLPNSK